MGRFDKLRGGTLVNLVGELQRRGFTFQFQKYPNLRNKWKLTFECPPGAKANFSSIVGSNEEMVKIGDALRMGGGTFLFNLSQAVGRFGEAATLRALRGGQIDHAFSVGGRSFNMRNMTLGETLQLQNRSGHGLDVITKITEPRPPAPRWVALEVKTRMGDDVPWPSLSDAQQQAGYLLAKADGALNGIQRARDAVRTGATRGRSWEDLVPQRRTIQEFRAAVESGSVTKILARAQVDRQGQLVGSVEALAW